MTTESALRVPTIGPVARVLVDGSDPRRGSLVSSLGEKCPPKGSKRCPNRRSQNLRGGAYVADSRGVFHFDSGARFEVILDCSSWSCEVCSWKKARNVGRLISGGLSYQLEQGRSVVFLTITEGGDFRSFRESAAALRPFMHSLNKWVGRRGLKGRLPYVAIPEMQKRGAVHWHLAIAHLCAPWDEKRRLSEFAFDGPARSGSLCTFEGLRGVAVSRSQTLLPMLGRYGFGLGQGRQLRQVGADGRDARGVAGYMSKGLGSYMSKAVGTAREIPKGASMLRGSKGSAAWWPGQSLETIRRDARLWSGLARSREADHANA
jgi:hypothetical protein